MLERESRHARDIASVHPDHRADAVNLMHYLALRRGDVRSLQRRLGQRGLSSLGRCEPHVLATVESVRRRWTTRPAVPVPPALSFEAGRAALDRNTDALFGPRPRGRVPRIMVTLPSEAADRLRTGAPSRLVGDGRGQDQRRPRRRPALGADGPQRPQGVRRGRPAVPDLHGPARAEDAHRPPGRGPTCRPSAAASGTCGAWPSRPATVTLVGGCVADGEAAPGPPRRRRLAGAPESRGRDRAGRHQGLASAAPGRRRASGAGRPPRSGTPPTSRPEPSCDCAGDATVVGAVAADARSPTCCARGTCSASRSD